MDTPPSPREVLFVDEYLVDFDAQRAYAAAGYQGGKNIRIHASRLLGKVHIQAAVQRAQVARRARLTLTADAVAKEVAELFFEPVPNIADIFDADGNLIAIKKLTALQASAIASVEVIKKNLAAGDGKTDTVHKVRLWDIRASKAKLAELAMRHLGMLNDKLDLTARLKFVNETATDEELLARLEVLLAKAKGKAAA